MKDKKYIFPFILINILLAITILAFFIKDIEYSNALLMFSFTFTIICIISIKNSDVGGIILLAYIIRIIMACLYTISGDSDPDGYGVRAIMMMEGGLINTIKNFETGAFFYSWIIAIFYSVFGVSEFMIRILNAFLSTLVVKQTYFLSRELFDRKIAHYSAAIVAFYPTLIRFSSPFASRETLLLYLMMAFLVLIYKYYKTGRLIHLGISILIVLLCTSLHTGMMVLVFMVFYILICKLKYSINGSKSSRDIARQGLTMYISVITIIGACIAIFIVMFKLGWGTEKLYLNNGGLSIDKIAWIQESSAIGRAAYLSHPIFSDPRFIIIFIPLRIIFFLYTPFLWMIRSVLDVLGFIDAILLMILTKKMYDYYKDFKVCKNNKNYSYIKSIFICTILLIIIFSIATSNYGTALRHRAKIIPILALLSAPKFIKNK